jgi:hypothetical protein
MVAKEKKVNFLRFPEQVRSPEIRCSIVILKDQGRSLQDIRLDKEERYGDREYGDIQHCAEAGLP